MPTSWMKKRLVKSEFRTVPIPSGYQLYNLADDPGERIDLSSQNPERVEAMKKLYTEWRSEMADPISGKKAR
ncbi:MAG: hypothetical protein P1V20_08355 [Verrucomicrobiales bacterium]|nr:hypothetical protein [Verrucomicrobiales bacterium]